MSKYVRVRFITKNEQPLTQPKFPCWCTGWDSEDNAYIVLFAEKEDYKNYIKNLYPDFSEDNISSFEERNEISFSSRFPKPDYFQE